MPSSILNSDDGVISGTSGLKSSGGDDGVLVFQSKGTETARINTDKQIEAAAGTVSLPSITTTGDVNTGIFFSAADTLVVTTGGTAAVTVDSGQRTMFPTTIGVGGATPSASGSGISFPASASASTDANTLDDYEEGTWTPSLGGTATFYSVNGTYTKIGRQVTVRGVVNIAAIGTGSTVQISGLPFACAGNFNGGTSYWANAASTLNFLALQTDAATTMQFYSSTAAASSLGSNAIFTSGTVVTFTVTYFV
jgi:hypothetical protein